MPTDGGAERILALQQEVSQLREAVVSHAVVDQAIGVVVALGRVTPGEGWEILRDVSQHTNVKLRSVAASVLAWGRTGVLAPRIRTALEAALDRHRPARVRDAPP